MMNYKHLILIILLIFICFCQSKVEKQVTTDPKQNNNAIQSVPQNDNSDLRRDSTSEYHELIGTKFRSVEDLPPELSINSVNSVAIIGNKHFDVSTVFNKFNDDFQYLFLTLQDTTSQFTSIILDVVKIDVKSFKEGSKFWFFQCSEGSGSDTELDIVGFYYHDEKMAADDVKVKPQKAWRPDYANNTLREIPVANLLCGSMTSDIHDYEQDYEEP